MKNGEMTGTGKEAIKRQMDFQVVVLSIEMTWIPKRQCCCDCIEWRDTRGDMTNLLPSCLFSAHCHSL